MHWDTLWHFCACSAEQFADSITVWPTAKSSQSVPGGTKWAILYTKEGVSATTSDVKLLKLILQCAFALREGVSTSD